MKLTFLGGAKTVTGSCFLLETKEEKILIDCGMFQGSKELQQLNEAPWPFRPKDISYVLVTHAHIDHTGRLPKLIRDGFKGKILCTKSTHDLCRVMLPDSGHIQEIDTMIYNRKRSRQRKSRKEPLYTQSDALAVIPHLIPLPYHERVSLSPYISVRFRDAGHILGSAIIELWVKEEGKMSKLTFSGDLGYPGQAIVRDPEGIEETDYLFVESTYGNRLHPPVPERTGLLRQVIEETRKDGGILLIPAFAIGRTQELLFHLHKLFKQNKIEPLPVYIDSPLAIAATEIFQANTDAFNEESSSLLERGENPLSFPGLSYVRTQEESQKLNELKESAIIIAGSGMADAGRILHHLKHQLWKENNHVAFVGYQAEGTLGRRLLSGATRVHIFGNHVRVAAKIHDLTALSSHADRDQLLSWLKKFHRPPKKVFVIHGEEESSLAFAQAVRQQLGWNACVPNRGEIVQLGAEEKIIANPQAEEPSPTTLSAAELDAYLQALESNVDGMREALRNHRLSEELRLQLSERILKLMERLDDLDEFL